MLVVHGTRKFLDRTGGVTVDRDTASTTRLGSWYATVLFWRPQAVLLVNESTLLPLLMPFAPAASLLDRLPASMREVFEAHDLDEAFIEAEVTDARPVELAKTADRSVLGVVTDFARLAGWWREDPDGPADLLGLSLRLAEVPTGPLYDSHVTPSGALAAVVAARR